MRLIAALLALLLAVPAVAQTPQERTRLQWVVTRGRLLFDVDRAAWVTTDDLQARVSRADLELVRGWTVERDGASFSVTYFVGEGESRAALYRARVENRQVVSREVFAAGVRPLLTLLQRRLADAFVAASRIDEQPCTPARFNVAVIPPDTPDGPIDVYALTPQTNTNVFPFGGHYRATIAADGTLSAKRGFMRSCFNMPRQEPGRDGAPAGLFLTHLLDPIPTEIHVFMSITIGMPVFVGTDHPRRAWAVTGEAIRLIEHQE
jgi:hypothetical protein